MNKFYGKKDALPQHKCSLDNQNREVWTEVHLNCPQFHANVWRFLIFDIENSCKRSSDTKPAQALFPTNSSTMELLDPYFQLWTKRFSLELRIPREQHKFSMANNRRVSEKFQKNFKQKASEEVAAVCGWWAYLNNVIPTFHIKNILTAEMRLKFIIKITEKFNFILIKIRIRNKKFSLRRSFSWSPKVRLTIFSKYIADQKSRPHQTFHRAIRNTNKHMWCLADIACDVWSEKIWKFRQINMNDG